MRNFFTATRRGRELAKRFEVMLEHARHHVQEPHDLQLLSEVWESIPVTGYQRYIPGWVFRRVLNPRNSVKSWEKKHLKKLRTSDFENNTVLLCAYKEGAELAARRANLPKSVLDLSGMLVFVERGHKFKKGERIDIPPNEPHSFQAVGPGFCFFMLKKPES